MVDTLHYLDYVAGLGRIAAGKASWLNTSKLEEDFMQFAAYCPRQALTVKEPLLYSLEGAERGHFQNAMAALGITAPVPAAVDIAGGFSEAHDSDALVFLSPDQMYAGHLTTTRCALFPLGS